MKMKGLLIATLLLPLIGLSGAAYAGARDFNPPRVPSQTDAQKGYTVLAQYMPMSHPYGYQCRYEGGPKSAHWHTRRQ